MRSTNSPGHHAIVLFSGGIDSTACLHFCLQEGHRPRALFVDYGQVARDREETAASAVTEALDIPLRKLHIGGAASKTEGLVQGRNAFLVLCALMEAGDQSSTIALGIHRGTSYWDCSRGFAELMQSLMDAYTGGRMQLLAPFLDWTKRETWMYCQEHHLPTHLTYSCERGVDQPCGQCLSCQDLELLNAGK